MTHSHDDQHSSEDLASVIEASAAATKGVGDLRLDLENALMDASQFGQLAYHAFCDLGFDRSDAPTLSQDESSLVLWTICEFSGMLNQAKTTFYKQCEAEGIAAANKAKAAS